MLPSDPMFIYDPVADNENLDSLLRVMCHERIEYRISFKDTILASAARQW